MKNCSLLFILALVLFGCSKEENRDPVHCDGLLTDTTGTSDNGRVYMPNAFTPNSDGLNDILRPTLQNISSFTFTLYDEDDVVIFTSSTAGAGFASTPPTSGFVKYYYKIQATTSAGKHIGTCGEAYKLYNCRPSGVTLAFEDQLTVHGFTGVTAEMLPAICP
jgi:hypothetical protein